MHGLPQGGPDWLFIYFYDPCEIILGETSENLAGESLVICTPGTIFSYGNPKNRWRHSWLQCTGTQIPVILQENGLAPLQSVPIPRPVIVERYLMRVFAEVSAHQNPNQRLLQNIFHNWIIEMSRTVRHLASDRPPAPKALEETKRYIDLHVAEKISLTQMACMSHLSVSHFSTLFRRYYNASPIDYQVHRRMETARYLLEIPGLSVTEIAERTGYAELYRFSRMFKKRFKMSPSVYRKGLLLEKNAR